MVIATITTIISTTLVFISLRSNLFPDSKLTVFKGYHVYTAAIIVYLDKKLNNSTDWLVQNSVFIYTLLRDVSGSPPLPHLN